MAVTIVEIARELGISHTTVSRVLNGKADNFISKKTQELVLRKSKEMKYTPNYHARALVTGKTNIVAFVGGMDLPDALYGWLIKDVRKMTLAKGYEVITGHPNTFLKMNIDGLIGYGVSNFESIAKLNIPIVDVGQWSTPPLTDLLYDTVIVDVRDGFRFILNHLYEQGCKEIAFVHMNPIEEWSNDPRVMIYKEFIAENSLEKKYIDVKHHSRDMIADEFQDYVGNNPKSDAYVCSNDNIAMGVILALYRAGVKVPEDALVTGFDGMPDTNTSIPPLTTLDIDYKYALQLGIDLLMDRLLSEDKSKKKIKVIKAHAIIRESAQKKC